MQGVDVLLQSATGDKASPGSIQVISTLNLVDTTKEWNFAWNSMDQVPNSLTYQLTSNGSPKTPEGLIMLSVVDMSMVYMNNIEVALHNFGDGRKFSNIAGILIAFACARSFELGRQGYTGYLAFDSKTDLISLYQTKYGATRVAGTRMYIDPATGRRLINQFLN